MEHPEGLPGGRNAKTDVNNQTSNNKISKRSNVMKHNRLFKIAATIFVALLFVVSATFAQGNVALSGTVDNTGGTIKVKGALSGSTKTINGTVEFAAVGAQDIPSGYTFTNLTASGGTGAKTIQGATTVSGTLTVSNGGQNLVLGSGYTLTYSGSGALVKTSGDFNFASGTVDYAANGTQTIYGTTYQNLTTSGASSDVTKTAGAKVVITGTLTNGAHNILDFSTYEFDGTNATIANSYILKSSGLVTVPSTKVINGKFQYVSSGAQAVAAAHYTDLTLDGAAKTASGDVYVAGTFTPTYGIAMGANTLEVDGTVGSYGTYAATGALQEVTGKMVVATPNAATYTLNNASTTVIFNAGDASRTFGLTVTPATQPNAACAATTEVYRKIAVNYSIWNTGTANLTLAYTTSDIAGFTGDQTKLKDFATSDATIGSKIVTGSSITRSSASAGVFGTIGLPGITPTLLPSTDLVILTTRAGAYSSVAATEWSVPSTWDEGSAPGTSDNVIINTLGVTLDGAAHVHNVVINATKSLTLGTASSALTVDADMTNNGTLTLGNGSSALNVTGTFTNASGSTLTNGGIVTVN
ncbi:MAG: hypothetical protein ABSC53_15765 [Bacteroidota bacterium]